MRGRSGIWKRKGRPNWFAWVGGKQVNLGTSVEKEALKEWHRLSGTEPRRLAAREQFVVALLDRFLDHLDETNSKYYKWYRSRVRSFAASIPVRLMLSQLQPRHISEWIGAHSEWSNTHKAGSISAVQRSLNWHLEEGTIKRNPVAKVKKPKRERRDFIFTPSQIQKLLDALKGPSRIFVELVSATGCRPSEMARAVGSDVSKDGALIAVRSSKNDKLDPMPVPVRLRAKVKMLAGLAGDGPLIMTERGSTWSRNTWCRAIQEVREGAGLDPLAVAYSLRHTWITERLKEGWSVADVALATRTSIAMISRVYAHLAGDRSRGLADKLG